MPLPSRIDERSVGARTSSRSRFHVAYAPAMSDRERLQGYVDVWWQAVDDFTRLLEHLTPEQWSAPTDLPGWDVRACAAHTAHLEAVLAGAPEETVEVEPGAHVRGLMGLYTEQGIVARAGRAT